MSGYYSTCNECKTHGVELESVTSYGGGNYRRPQRSYRPSICHFCINEMAAILEARPEHQKDSHHNRIYGYDGGSIMRAAKRIAEFRTAEGDFATGARAAQSYWLDYKRLNKPMAERLEAETEEFRVGFNSVTH